MHIVHNISQRTCKILHGVFLNHGFLPVKQAEVGFDDPVSPPQRKTFVPKIKKQHKIVYSMCDLETSQIDGLVHIFCILACTVAMAPLYLR